MDVDDFFVSCERLLNSSLNGIPLIIGGSNERGIVASCSPEAKYFGVRPSMTMRMALQLCPQAKVVRGDQDNYSKQSKIITEVLEEQAPALEKSRMDEFYIDTTGMDRFFGTFLWTSELIKKVQSETGLPVSFGLSINKTVAKIATSESRPKGKRQVESPEVKPFMYPLSVRKIPQVGRETYHVLSRIGIRKIETLAEMPSEIMQKVLGKPGLGIWRKANGIDPAPIIPYSEKKSISVEKTFEKDTIKIRSIQSLLIAMVEKVCFELRQQKKVASIITVKIRYTNLDTHVKQQRISYTASDAVFIGAAQALFKQLFERRMLIRTLGVKLSGLVGGAYQINLFEDSAEQIALYQAMDRMRKRYGARAVIRSASMGAMASINR